MVKLIRNKEPRFITNLNNSSLKIRTACSSLLT